MFEHIISIFWVGALSVTALFFVIWLIHLPLKNAAIVDIGWGLGFIVLCAVAIVMGEGFNTRNSILLTLIALWGIRIVFFLIKRISREGKEDPRYQKFRLQWGKDAQWRFLLLFESQALLETVIGFAFIVIALNPTPEISWLEIFGALVFLGALLGETIADRQLQTFKRNLQNKGKICQVGFWNYSRHPNYFFEWLIWLGLFIYALPSPWGWTAVLSPAVMYWLMMYVSGVPLAEEQALKSRGEEYKKYQRTTSVFLPLPKRTS